MTIAEWRDLSTRDARRAAAELHRRVSALPETLRRAAISHLVPEPAMAGAMAAATADTPLRGVPCFLKDLFPLAGVPTRAGSAFLAAKDGALAGELRAAGAVIAGKTHLHEFAYGLTGQNPHYGDCEHPRFPGRTSGGSSSGSAALVAADVAPLAFGTDTGGSVRVPAAFCGLYGFRLTPRDRFIRDAFPLAPGFDTAGWFTRTADDLLTVNRVLLGPEEPPAREPKGCWLDLEKMTDGADPEIVAACRQGAGSLAAPADAITEAELVAGFRGALETYAALQSAEAFLGHRPWFERYRARYSPEVWSRIDRGRQWTRAELDRAEVKQMEVRALWRRFFDVYDFLVLPAAHRPALKREELTLANRNRLLTLTAPASLGGCPVLTIPLPLASGLSAGLQIVLASPRSPAVSGGLARLRL